MYFSKYYKYSEKYDLRQCYHGRSLLLPSTHAVEIYRSCVRVPPSQWTVKKITCYFRFLKSILDLIAIRNRVQHRKNVKHAVAAIKQVEQTNQMFRHARSLRITVVMRRLT